MHHISSNCNSPQSGLTLKDLHLYICIVDAIYVVVAARCLFYGALKVKEHTIFSTGSTICFHVIAPSLYIRCPHVNRGLAQALALALFVLINISFLFKSCSFTPVASLLAELQCLVWLSVSQRASGLSSLSSVMSMTCTC